MINATKKWIFLKISGAILVPLMLWFIINLIHILEFVVFLLVANYNIAVQYFDSYMEQHNNNQYHLWTIK